MKIKISCYLSLLMVVVGGVMVAKKNSLKAYRMRRNFTRTKEPKGKIVRSRGGKLFVIQKHQARALHYDFRLSIDGVLKSWAVPKGPSLNPAVKRLAIPTEDHPLSYGRFEGVIPKSEYGAGPVMIWDKGTYKNIKKKDGTLIPMKQCLKDGTIEVFLNGKKLLGGFALIRVGKPQNERWLLIKMRDEYASARKNPVNTEKKSVVTGRTMNEIKKDAKQ